MSMKTTARREVAETKTQYFDDSDYEYGYDYLYEGEQQALTEIDLPDSDDDDIDEIPADEKALIDILPPLPPEEEDERGKLKRELREEAMRRMEEAARTTAEFKQMVAMWDRLDRNRERKERYHEILRGDTPLEYGVKNTYDALIFPEWKNTPLERQLAHGNFLDWLSDCPYEMHDLTSKKYIRKTVMEMKDDHKELLYLLGVKHLSPQEVAILRGQTDRNVRKVRDVAIRKVQRKLYAALKKMTENGYDATFEYSAAVARCKPHQIAQPFRLN